MQLEFVPVEEFYFELTLALKPLGDIENPALAAQVGAILKERFGQSSTVAAANQNTYNYVFKVTDVDNSPFNRLVVSVGDWGNNLRLSSDYGWKLNETHRAEKSDRFASREQFAQDFKAYVQTGWALRSKL
jgi:hypothetical protein